MKKLANSLRRSHPDFSPVRLLRGTGLRAADAGRERHCRADDAGRARRDRLHRRSSARGAGPVRAVYEVGAVSYKQRNPILPKFKQKPLRDMCSSGAMWFFILRNCYLNARVHETNSNNNYFLIFASANNFNTCAEG